VKNVNAQSILGQDLLNIEMIQMKVKEEFATIRDVMKLTTLIMVMEDSSYLRKKLVALMKEETEKTGKIMIQKALDDGKITEKEITRLETVYGARRDEVAEIFKLYYDTGIEIDDGNKGEKHHIMVTVKGSGIWNMREYIKEKYGLVVLNEKEAIEFMQDIEFNKKFGIKNKYDFGG